MGNGGLTKHNGFNGDVSDQFQEQNPKPWLSYHRPDRENHRGAIVEKFGWCFHEHPPFSLVKKLLKHHEKLMLEFRLQCSKLQFVSGGQSLQLPLSASTMTELKNDGQNFEFETQWIWLVVTSIPKYLHWSRNISIGDTPWDIKIIPNHIPMD